LGKKFNIILILILIGCGLIQSSIAADVFKIYNKEITGNVIDLGICHIDDSLTTSFIIENNSATTVKIGNLVPEYYLGSASTEFIRYRSFFTATEPPFSIAPNSQKEYKLSFNLKGDPNGFLDGLFKANLQFGIKSGNDSIQSEFIIIARKSKSYIGIYDTLNFDSVMIDAASPVMLDLNMMNVWKTPIRAFADTFLLKSSKLTADEFTIEKGNRKFPWDFQPKDKISPFSVSYLPKDAGLDIAQYKLYYYKNILFNPNDMTIDSTVMEARGIGIKQNIEIISVDGNSNFVQVKPNVYNLEIGEIRVGEKKKLKIALKNSSNYNFGRELTELIGNGNLNFQLLRDLTKSFNINQIDTIEFELSPFVFGELTQFMVIHSDANSRGIKGAIRSNTDFVLNLIGKAIEPKIFISNTSIDFGNIIKADSCPISINKTITLKNIGNSELLITDMKLMPENNSFSPSIAQTNIPVNNEQELRIIFNPNALGQQKSTLLLMTNLSAPNDTIEIDLTGIGIDAPNAKIDIDSKVGFPGNDVVIEFKLNNSISQLANSFKDQLIFDSSILKFSELITDNTALDGLSNSSTFEVDASGLNLNLKRVNNQNFLPNDVLFKIKFKTYLGNSQSTSILLTNPKFGNSICESIFVPNLSKGYFAIDSVCGLGFKTKPIPDSQFKIANLNFNQSNEAINISIDAPFSSNGIVTIYNFNGDLFEAKQINLRKEYYNDFNIPFYGNPSGLYFVRFECGIYTEVKPIIIYR